MTTTKPRRSSSKTVPRAGAAGRHDTPHGFDWPLAYRGEIECYDEYSGETVVLIPGQRDPANVEGLLIDFRYISRDREVSRRCLLCWQCGRSDKHLYVRGYCPFREELRTFRVDPMNDVMAIHGGRYVAIADVQTYFAAYAAGHTTAIARRLLDSSDE